MAANLGRDISDDAEVVTLRNAAWQAILPYTTSELLQLAPTLVGHIHNVVEALPPKVTLGASLGGPRVPAIPHVKVSMTMMPSALQMSVLSLSAAPPCSRSLSTSLGVSCPSPRQAVVDITDRPSHPLPHHLILTEVPSVVIPVPHPVPPSAHPVPSASLPILPPPASSSASASATASLHTFTKRPAPGNAGLLLVAMDHCPQEWWTYASCKQSKAKCHLAVGTHPPYVACMACLNRGCVCEPCPLKQKRNKKKHSPMPPPKSGTATASLVFHIMEKPTLLLTCAPFLTCIPPLLTRSSSATLLRDLISWHAEIERAMAEHQVACLVQNAAILRILQADNRRRMAWNNFALLMGNLGAPPYYDKGKGRMSSPVSIHDNSDTDVAGFANDPQTGDDSGDEDDEDNKYDDEDKDGDGSGSVMNVL